MKNEHLLCNETTFDKKLHSLIKSNNLKFSYDDTVMYVWVQRIFIQIIMEML